MYYTIYTQAGLGAEAAAKAGGDKVDFVQMAVGDGNGSDVTPDKDMTSLVNEVWRGDVSIVSVTEESANWVSVEAKIPVAVGGWIIREVGLFNAAGTMLAIANYPATPKPVLADGIYRDCYLRLYIAVESTDNITLTVDPDVVMATREYVDSLVEPLQLSVLEVKRRAFFYANTLF
ncbi:phage tail protein [uncultured Desulfobacter sp.]|uniref:phage tail protein n=1 Tax=uncultured Desulfobacter sp. TaxID=240139 RepID=UPI002AAA8452|nr:phage tail protein [uncultured Desulfobacter sp.]